MQDGPATSFSAFNDDGVDGLGMHAVEAATVELVASVSCEIDAVPEGLDTGMQFSSLSSSEERQDLSVTLDGAKSASVKIFGL